MYEVKYPEIAEQKNKKKRFHYLLSAGRGRGNSRKRGKARFDIIATPILISLANSSCRVHFHPFSVGRPQPATVPDSFTKYATPSQNKSL